MKRSIMSAVVELYLRLTEKHYTVNRLKRDIESRKTNGDTPYIMPRKIYKGYSFSEKEYQGMQVFYANEGAKNDRAVMYLHGGAYYRKPRKHHFKFVGRVSRETGIPFVAPIYKKAPNHTCQEAYEVLSELYLDLKARYKEVILMGDSSGGGLALGLTLYIKNQGYDMPSTLVLLSPWVDVALCNREIEGYIKKDPIVFLDNVRLLGRKWADGLPLDDYRVSPICGDMTKLPKTYIFCGTREILYPDCVRLYEKMKNSGTRVCFYEGIGQNHVYPIFPLIREAKESRKTIEAIIKS